MRLYDPIKLAKYPHMSPDDVHVWERFLDQHSKLFTKIAYDVRVGHGQTPPPGVEDEIKRMTKALTQKRIDAVGFSTKLIWIIEVKKILTVSTPGQIIAYKELYRDQFQPKLPTLPTIVYERAQPDMEQLSERFHVFLFKV